MHNKEIKCKRDWPLRTILVTIKVFICNPVGLVLELPCLLSTSIKDVKAVPPTVHFSTGAPRFPT